VKFVSKCCWTVSSVLGRHHALSNKNHYRCTLYASRTIKTCHLQQAPSATYDSCSASTWQRSAAQCQCHSNIYSAPCDNFKHQRKAKICHRKTTVSPVLKDHFGDHKPQRDDDMKAAAILLTYLEETFFFFLMHYINVERVETLRIFLNVLHVGCLVKRSSRISS